MADNLKNQSVLISETLKLVPKLYFTLILVFTECVQINRYDKVNMLWVVNCPTSIKTNRENDKA